MALFLDGPPSAIEDLSAQDSQLQDLANVAGIDVTQKLALAWDEVGVELYCLLKQSAPETGLWQATQIDLGTVVVTPPLKLWHTYRALELVYEDAYSGQLNDRYSGKRDYFHERAKWAHGKLLDIGIGIALTPLTRAAKPTVTAVPAIGASLPDATYYVAAAWMNRNGEEGAASEPVALTIAGNTLSVQPGPVPLHAVSWNIYAGIDPNALALQNAVPVPAANAWVQPAPLAPGRKPGNGQPPNFVKAMPRLMQRG